MTRKSERRPITLKHHLWSLGLLTLWSLIAAVSWATSSYETSLRYGNDPDWLNLFGRYLVSNGAWILFAPAICILFMRFPYHPQQVLRFCLAHIIAGLPLCALRDATSSYLINTLYGGSYPLFGYGPLLFHFLHYAMFLAVFNGFFFYREFRRRQVLTSQLETQLARSQLKLLRMQLQPHFLFNTLNTIASLNLHDVKAANRMISRLSDLLRISLADMGRQEVPLRKEVDFLKRYLEIEQIRFGDRLAIEMDIPPELLEAHVPNLILQPIVENAVRHGIQRTASPGRITVGARRRGGDLVVEIGDNGPGFDGHRPPASQQLGLSNTRERLAKMYGGAAALEIVDNATGDNATGDNAMGDNDAGDHDVKGALVRLTLPFHTAPIGGDSAESADSAETANSGDEPIHE
jgi:hypothetical protein